MLRDEALQSELASLAEKVRPDLAALERVDEDARRAT
jgi:hypothetical protein